MAEEKKVTKPGVSKRQPEKPKKEHKPKPLVHVSEFIAAITPIYNLTSLQRAGFNAYMGNDQYKEDLNDFVPFLDKYLGK